MKRRQLLILAGDADGNLGDRAIVQAMCLQARAIDQQLQISLVSGQPWRWEPEGIRVIPRGVRGLGALMAAATRSELVLCGGGGLFQDDDSLVKMPYWGLRVALARLLCRSVVGYSLGVGPLKAWTSRAFARLAFACMSSLSARDPLAQATAQRLTSKEVHLVPDPALLLPPVSAQIALDWLAEQRIPRDGSPLIGVTARRWLPPRYRIIPHRLTHKLDARQGPETDRLIESMAKVLDEIIKRHSGYALFLPTYSLPHEGDDRVCAQILSAMSSPRGKLVTIDDPALYKGVAAQLRVMVSGRMHPTIFAASVGSPVVGLAYNPKFQGFFEMLGPEHQVVSVSDFLQAGGTDRLIRMIEAALRAPGDDLRSRTSRLGELNRQFTQRILE